MLSVIIIAKNEAKNIRRCLESVSFADEIIVLDSGSSDDTVAIAKEYTDQVVITDWQGYGIQKQRALSYARGDWVLNLDADEQVAEDTAKEIQHAIATDAADAYRMPIQMHFYGKTLRYSASPKRHIRLFKRNYAQFTNVIVHEHVILSPSARIAALRSPLIHYSFHDLSHALYKINLYSSSTAKIRNQSQKNYSLWRSSLGAVWMFFRAYILQRGFLDGKMGFVLATLQAHGSFYRALKTIYKDDDGQQPYRG